ncbi:hypothetical protein [Luteibacter sp.]|jgi:hypothetical protein|uniref:hypothetical protein n=1 Tax=Luteibacter sp. TaxID=1886636 RepID=UPI002F4031EC
MTTPVFIDGCAWNHFFDSGADLEEVLPANLYRLFITSEVGIEIQEIPEREDKQALKISCLPYQQGKAAPHERHHPDNRPNKYSTKVTAAPTKTQIIKNFIGDIAYPFFRI